MLNKEQIKEIIPQREPFLMIDEVEDFIPGESATAYKYVNDNDFCYCMCIYIDIYVYTSWKMKNDFRDFKYHLENEILKSKLIFTIVE